MPRRRGETSRFVQIGTWSFAVVTPVSALALGAIPVEALAVVSLLSAVHCALLWWESGNSISRSSRVVLAAFLLLTGFTMLQLVPLPAAVVRLVAPENAEIWSRALSPLKEAGPAWHPISVAPVATGIQALRGLFYGLTFLSAIRIGSLEHGHRFLIRLVVVSSSLMAFVALAHLATSAERVFGIYRPTEAWAFVHGRISPLLNTNHLAAYCSIGALVAFGALLSKRSIPRALSASMLIVTGVTSLLQSSRGATGALIFGLVAILGLHVYTRKNFAGGRAQAFLLAGCFAAALVIVGITMSDAREHLASRDFVKFQVAASSLRLVRSSPWIGFGRGSFETVFSMVREGRTYMTWTNPEDLPIQWLVEWGVPLSIAGVALLIWALRPQVMFNAVAPVAGPWIAVVATVLHDLVDYHLEVPGIMALVAVCAAAVTSGGSTKNVASESTGRMRVFVLGTAAVAVGLAVWLVVGRGHTLAEERRRMSAEAVDSAVSTARFHDDIRAAILRYPAEPFFPLLGAVKVQTTGDGSIVPWIGRALERSPRFGRAHLVLARGLARRNPSQARLEYRLAYQNDAALRDVVVREALLLVNDSDDAMEIVPDGEDGVPMLEVLSDLLAKRLPATAYLLDRELERRAPDNALPMRRRTESMVQDVLDGEPWCAAADCMQTAERAVDAWAKREPDQCRPHILATELELAAQVPPAKAFAALEARTERVSNPSECARQIVELALAHGQKQLADGLLEHLLKRGCGSRGECEEFWGWAAGIHEGHGRFVAAVALYRRIVDNNPSREDILQHIGELGGKDGLRSEAIDAYRILATRHPDDPRWNARAAELRGSMPSHLLPSVPMPSAVPSSSP